MQFFGPDLSFSFNIANSATQMAGITVNMYRKLLGQKLKKEYKINFICCCLGGIFTYEVLPTIALCSGMGQLRMVLLRCAADAFKA